MTSALPVNFVVAAAMAVLTVSMSGSLPARAVFTLESFSSIGSTVVLKLVAPATSLMLPKWSPCGHRGLADRLQLAGVEGRDLGDVEAAEVTEGGLGLVGEALGGVAEGARNVTGAGCVRFGLAATRCEAEREGERGRIRRVFMAATWCEASAIGGRWRAKRLHESAGRRS